MKLRRSVSLMLACLMLAGAACGCGGNKADNGKIPMEVAQWPDETDPERMEVWKKAAADFEVKYPEIDVIEGNTYGYDPETFAIKANAKQLPSFIDTYFTEMQQMISSGQVSDITDILKDNGLLDVINPDMLALCSDENGRVYGFPKEAYTQGLLINKELFAKAGLVNEDGSPKVPQTYQELAEYAQIIKEKTGVSGFALPTTGNCGGWIFMNIAWSFGANFEEKQSDGSWKAIFDTPQFKEAIQFVKDLRFKYNALPDNKVIDLEEYRKLFGTGQVAMIINSPDGVSTMARKYGFNKDNAYVAKLPAGPAGRYAQMGGGITVFGKENTPEETDAAIKWIMFRGRTPEITEEIEATLNESYQDSINLGSVVFPKTFFDIWTDPERTKKDQEIRAKYTNVSMKDYEDYASFEGVTIRPEESACCQQLYAILDGVIQAVITDENSDIDALTKTAVDDFQKNHLDNLG